MNWWERHRWIEKLCIWAAWRLPHGVVYWCFMRVWGNGTSGEFGMDHPDHVSWGNVESRWRLRRGGDYIFYREEP